MDCLGALAGAPLRRGLRCRHARILHQPFGLAQYAGTEWCSLRARCSPSRGACPLPSASPVSMMDGPFSHRHGAAVRPPSNLRDSGCSGAIQGASPGFSGSMVASCFPPPKPIPPEKTGYLPAASRAQSCAPRDSMSDRTFITSTSNTRCLPAQGWLPSTIAPRPVSATTFS